MTRRKYHPRGELVEGHRITEHPLYYTHSDMLRRCSNPSDPGYPNYGGRGIKVCERWHDFRNFVSDMGPKPLPKYTIERKNNDGDYEPSNCTWATRSEQCDNRRKFRNNTSGARGVVKTSAGWHARYDYEHTRYNIGWFKTNAEGVAAREAFVALFHSDRDAAIASIQDRVRNNSSTRHRGVTPCEEGYIARCTIDGERHYIGYFKDIDDAVAARDQFIAERTGRVAGRI